MSSSQGPCPTATAQMQACQEANNCHGCLQHSFKGQLLRHTRHLSTGIVAVALVGCFNWRKESTPCVSAQCASSCASFLEPDLFLASDC